MSRLFKILSLPVPAIFFGGNNPLYTNPPSFGTILFKLPLQAIEYASHEIVFIVQDFVVEDYVEIGGLNVLSLHPI